MSLEVGLERSDEFIAEDRRLTDVGGRSYNRGQ